MTDDGYIPPKVLSLEEKLHIPEEYGPPVVPLPPVVHVVHHQKKPPENLLLRLDITPP